jgi:ribonuclease HI
MNDKAELVAATLAIEGAVDQPLAFTDGIEIIIDNKAVCDSCRLIAGGQTPRPTLAHIVWYRRVAKAVSLLAADNRCVRFTWVPSHTTSEDVIAGKITHVQRLLNVGADKLASIGKAANAPPIDVVNAASRRKAVVTELQTMLVEIHLSRKQKEELRIKALLSSQKILKAPCPPKADNKLSLLQVKAMVPNFCLDPGFPLLSVPNLAGKLSCIHLPGSSRTSSQALSAIKWYWSKLAWPQQVDPLNRGASWVELFLDFSCSTNCRIVGSTHTMRTNLDDAKGAFSSLARFLKQREEATFPTDAGRVTSLGPFGVRNAVAGLKVAPRFLCPEVWVPFLWSSTKDLPDPFASLSRLKVSSFPSSPPLYSPLREGFDRLFAPPPPS